ncbi:MAG: histidine--tRNA ligase [Candidatus Thermoplasmatota archaeon]|nr:histidine--tRNA ligase [Candidatus Thermoplasmatota archaeon]
MIQRPRGTRDFGPDEMFRRRQVENIMRKTCKTFGYREIATPTFESTELFTKKSGEGIVKQLYNFKDKAGRDIALRPELTAPAIRFYVNEMQSLPKPLKLFYFGNCFRYEEPQKGRFREFYQFGVECIGGKGEAEVMALAVKMLENTGLKNFELRVGHLGILRNILGNADSSVMTLIDKKNFDEVKEKITDEKYKKLMKAVYLKDEIFEDKEFKGKDLDDLKNVLEEMELFGVKKYSLDFSIARGLDYYSGVVFEIDCPDLGSEKQVCGGGTYNLSGLFGGEEMDSTGFAIGFDRVMIALEAQRAVFNEDKMDAYVIPIGDNAKKRGFEIANMLREKGVKCDIDLIGRSIAKNMKYADSTGVKKAVILGEDEMKENIITLRDMKTGKQEKIPVKNLIKHLKEEK